MDNITKTLQLVLLGVILVSTVIAVGIEIRTMFLNQSVTLADLLLMFLYLEVMAMVRVFWEQQSISISLPLLIAITALSRFIILQGKSMDPSALLYEAGAILLIAAAIVVLRLRQLVVCIFELYFKAWRHKVFILDIILRLDSSKQRIGEQMLSLFTVGARTWPQENT